MLGGAGLLFVATPAQAADISYKTECIPPSISGLDPVQGTTITQITAPATAKVGDTVNVTWKFVQGASKNPDVLDLSENTVQPTGTLKAAGAQTGDIDMQGPRENPAIPKNSPMKLSTMTGKLKLEKPGEVKLTPDKYNINVSKPMSTDTKCSPKEAVDPGAVIKVLEGAGGSGGSSSGSGGAIGGLPGTSSGGSSSSGGGTSSGGSSTSGGSTSGGGDSGGQSDFTGKEVSVPYSCKTPIGDKSATSPVQINAKKDGGNFGLTVKFKKSVMDSPADIPADSVKPSMEVKLGGSDKGTVPVEGPTNKKPFKSGDPIEIPDLTGTYKPGADGKSTLSPGVLTVKALGTTTTCTPNKAPVSLELDTSKQAGGAAGGTGSEGGSAGGGGAGSAAAGGGGLAETGSSNDGALRALGLAAGTVILLGGAVFTFLPRARRVVRR
ncbi:hypothetical protein ACFV9W_27020 [Streptomyces sp. NPDC059897]|uniref:hypothetical protein n=1 Tax=Streptomyces sp. NPDC059897 TaxID=3346994 RepID=UPI00365C1A56